MKAKKPIRYVIQNCQITNEGSPPLNENTVHAVRAVADACAANARALEECAKRLAGPPDNRVGIYVGDRHRT